MSAIETRTMFEHGKLKITASMYADDGEPNFPDFGPDGKDDELIFRKHYNAGDFFYVGMVATVYYAGAEISSDSLWGTEHGQVGTVGEGGYTGPGSPGDPVNADAWEITWPEYPADNAIIAGSSLAGVIDEAIGHAVTWADANGNDEMAQALAAATRWADPNAPAPTIVVFRVWKGKNGGVIALFPYEPGTVGKPETCSSFEHIGQHGAAYLADVISATRAATPEEYGPLKKELESKPYRYTLIRVDRTPRDAAAVRTAKLKASR